MQIKKLRKTILTTVTVAAATALALFVLLPLVLPFLLGYLLALLAEPGVRALGRVSPLPRWLRSGLCVAGLFLVAGGLLVFFSRVLWGELRTLVRQLPELMTRLQAPTEALREKLEALAARAPGDLGPALSGWVDRLFAGGTVFAGSLSRWLTAAVSGAVTKLPRLLLTVVTTVIAAFMTSAALPDVKGWLRAKLPAAWLKRLAQLRDRIGTALGGWLRAQLKLLGIVFAVLTLGLWLLQTDFALLFGGLIALLDALPVLGSGVVLVPWAVISFLQGSSGRGFGLLALYAAVSLTRTILEPRLVGKQLGLHPLVTLAAFYVGYRTLGVAGMVLLPICAVLTRQIATLLEPRRPGEALREAK